MAEINIKDITTDEDILSLKKKGKVKGKAKIQAAPPPPPPQPEKKIEVDPRAASLIQQYQQSAEPPVQIQEQQIDWTSVVLWVAGGFLVGWGVCRLARAIFSTGTELPIDKDEILKHLTAEQVAEILTSQ